MNAQNILPLRDMARERLRDKNVIAVASAKGGVGKSLISSLLALGISRRDNVILMDLDLHGMSIPKLFGLDDKIHEVTKDGIMPISINDRLSVVSLGNVVGDRYVVLPGKNKNEVIESLLAFTNYGKSHTVIVDMPPGLSDEVLVLQRVVKFRVYVVTTPSTQSFRVVKYLLDYLGDVGIKPDSLIINMAYLDCNGQRIHVFGNPSVVRDMASKYGIDKIIELPIDPSIEDFIGHLQDYNGALIRELANVILK